jgi:hypothetical protein
MSPSLAHYDGFAGTLHNIMAGGLTIPYDRHIKLKRQGGTGGRRVGNLKGRRRRRSLGCFFNFMSYHYTHLWTLSLSMDLLCLEWN